eukprot:CAMPEP_0175108400 /NCGR_PEP_ID=MMETSP0086_2-20121207/12619_1 /TAXON_ID=136419 /ORGANISM="Unknown Unknown, Strain D1" /LENGTH=990 /DNA_ID=CAMNT_0016385613 /DNA_START=61 /DNA_END=3033 /DNA_ORIENTATION=-
MNIEMQIAELRGTLSHCDITGSIHAYSLNDPHSAVHTTNVAMAPSAPATQDDVDAKTIHPDRNMKQLLEKEQLLLQELQRVQEARRQQWEANQPPSSYNFTAQSNRTTNSFPNISVPLNPLTFDQRNPSSNQPLPPFHAQPPFQPQDPQGPATQLSMIPFQLQHPQRPATQQLSMMQFQPQDPQTQYQNPQLQPISSRAREEYPHSQVLSQRPSLHPQNSPAHHHQTTQQPEFKQVDPGTDNRMIQSVVPFFSKLVRKLPFTFKVDPSMFQSVMNRADVQTAIETARLDNRKGARRLMGIVTDHFKWAQSNRFEPSFHKFSNSFQQQFQLDSITLANINQRVHETQDAVKETMYFVGFGKVMSEAEKSAYRQSKAQNGEAVLRYCFANAGNDQCSVSFVFEPEGLKTKDGTDEVVHYMNHKEHLQNVDEHVARKFFGEPVHDLGYPVPQELRTVIETFDTVKHEAHLAEKDGFVQNLLQAVGEYLTLHPEKIGEDEGWFTLAGAWKRSKNAAKHLVNTATSAAKSLGTFVMQHPIVVNVILLISKLLRTVICAFMSGVTYAQIKQTITSLIQDVFGNVPGTRFFAALISCVLSLFSSTAVSAVFACLKDTLGALYASIFGFLGAVVEVASGTIRWLLSYLGTVGNVLAVPFAMTEATGTLLTNPTKWVQSWWSDEAAVEVSLGHFMRKHFFRQSALLFLQIAAEYFPNVILGILGMMPGLGTIVNLVQTLCASFGLSLAKGITFSLRITLMVIDTQPLTQLMDFLNELWGWFDVLAGCAFKRILNSLFGVVQMITGGGQTAVKEVNVVTCCMKETVDQLKAVFETKSVFRSSPTQILKNVTGRAGNWFTGVFCDERSKIALFPGTVVAEVLVPSEHGGREKRIKFFAFAWKKSTPFSCQTCVSDKIFFAPSAQKLKRQFPSAVINFPKLGYVIDFDKCPTQLQQAFVKFKVPFFRWNARHMIDFKRGKVAATDSAMQMERFGLVDHELGY